MQSASKVSTCLWFDGHAEQAVTLYTSLLPNSEVHGLLRSDPKGSVLLVDFTLAGVPYQALNGGPQHTLSEAASIVVTTEDQPETDRLWAALTAEGGRESRCGWLVDGFGLSWQIVPQALRTCLASEDRSAARRVMQAMLAMSKIDIEVIEAAYRGP